MPLAPRAAPRHGPFQRRYETVVIASHGENRGHKSPSYAGCSASQNQRFAFKQGCCSALLTPVFTEKHLHREAFTERSIHTEKLVHREAFTHRSFYSHKLLRTEASTQVTQRNFYTEPACTQRSCYTHTHNLLHIEGFTQRNSYTDQAFTQRNFYTEPSFTQGNLFHKSILYTEPACTQKSCHLHNLAGEIAAPNPDGFRGYSKKRRLWSILK